MYLQEKNLPAVKQGQRPTDKNLYSENKFGPLGGKNY